MEKVAFVVTSFSESIFSFNSLEINLIALSYTKRYKTQLLKLFDSSSELLWFCACLTLSSILTVFAMFSSNICKV
jgi:hypothetical protein